MSECGWTKGPWHWVDSENDGPVTDSTWVASLRTVEEFQSPHSSWSLPKWVLNTDGGKGDMSKADAHLIAAAPDLYEALEKIMNHHASSVLFGNREMAENAWNSLAKARGEAQ